MLVQFLKEIKFKSVVIEESEVEKRADQIADKASARFNDKIVPASASMVDEENNFGLMPTLK